MYLHDTSAKPWKFLAWVQRAVWVQIESKKFQPEINPVLAITFVQLIALSSKYRMVRGNRWRSTYSIFCRNKNCYYRPLSIEGGNTGGGGMRFGCCVC